LKEPPEKKAFRTDSHVEIRIASERKECIDKIREKLSGLVWFNPNEFGVARHLLVSLLSAISSDGLVDKCPLEMIYFRSSERAYYVYKPRLTSTLKTI
jgi:hypothetical protein